MIAASTVIPVAGVVLGETLHWNEPADGVPAILGILISQSPRPRPAAGARGAPALDLCT
ncbi:hypothetical protein [Nonomuraea jabiensis]|uniref:hypothetical protein n=1 Tax=Nonomuraea jabiensis TaxID=882448 RepID=UPI0036859EB2